MKLKSQELKSFNPKNEITDKNKMIDMWVNVPTLQELTYLKELGSWKNHG